MTGSRETRRPHTADGCSRHSRIFSLTPPAQRREASARCPLYEVTARAGALTGSHIFAQPEGSDEGTGGSNAGIGAGRRTSAAGIGAGRPAPAFRPARGFQWGTGGSNAGIGAGRRTSAAGIGAGRPAPATGIDPASQAQAAQTGPTSGRL